MSQNFHYESGPCTCPKCAPARREEDVECNGSVYCKARVHVHGCFNERNIRLPVDPPVGEEDVEALRERARELAGSFLLYGIAREDWEKSEPALLARALLASEAEVARLSGERDEWRASSALWVGRCLAAEGERDAWRERAFDVQASQDRAEAEVERLREALVAADTFWAKPDTKNSRRAQRLTDAALNVGTEGATTRQGTGTAASVGSSGEGASSQVEVGADALSACAEERERLREAIEKALKGGLPPLVADDLRAALSAGAEQEGDTPFAEPEMESRYERP